MPQNEKYTLTAGVPMKTVLMIFFVIIMISKSYSKVADHRGYYSTKNIPIEQNAKHLKKAIAASLKAGEKSQIMLLYIDRDFNADSCTFAGIEILNSDSSRVFIKCPLSVIPYLYSLSGVLHVARPYPVTPQMDTSRILCHINEAHKAQPPTYPGGPYTGKKVLVGIIDTEFDTHHPAFLDSLKRTRFFAIWDQADSSEKKLNKYGFGTIKNHQQLLIDTTFGSRGKFHGTLTAGAAVGSEYSSGYYGAAPEAIIIGVCYDFENHLSVINGIEWIFSIADSLNLPCVINLSLGIALGPHDGTSEIDKTIDRQTGPGRIIVGAAGNDGNTRSHVLFSLGKNQRSGTWIKPRVVTDSDDNSTSSLIDIWGVRRHYFSVTTQMYNVVTSQLIEDTIGFSTNDINVFKQDTVVWNSDTFYFDCFAERSSNLNRNPHAQVHVKGTNPDVRIGVRILSTTTNTTIHAWNGHKQSLESLDLDGYISGDNNFSVNEIGGTAKNAIVVGSYLFRSDEKLWNDSIIKGWEGNDIGDLAKFSGWGPTVDGRIRPDITAPGAKVHSSMSFYADDYGQTVFWPDPSRPYGRYSSVTGTSISAPIVTGTVALLLQAKPQLTSNEIKTALQSSAITDTKTGPLPSPDNKWGAGKLNAIDAIRHVLGITGVRNQLIQNSKPPFKISGTILTINNFDPAKDRIRIVNLRGIVIKEYQSMTTGTVILPHPGVYTVVFYSGKNSVIAQRVLTVK